MFDIAPTELLLVAVVALVVIGPKDLPRVMRVVGKWVARARGMARHFRDGMDEMIRQSELEEMEKKWKAENERIMREHPVSDMVHMTALPSPQTPDHQPWIPPVAPDADPLPDDIAAEADEDAAHYAEPMLPLNPPAPAPPAPAPPVAAPHDPAPAPAATPETKPPA